MAASTSPKTVALDPEAYELLRKNKREGESFSDVVKRTMRPFRGISELAGAWADIPEDQWKSLEEWRRSVRALDDAKHEQLMRRMLESSRKRR